MGVEALSPKPAIEAFCKGVLNRFSWLDEVDGNPLHGRPCLKTGGAKLRTIVTDDTLWFAMLLNSKLEYFKDRASWQTGRRMQHHTFAGEVIDGGKDAYSLAI